MATGEAKKIVLAPDEPLTDPITTAEPPPAPVALPSAPDEPLAAPVETRSAPPASKADPVPAVGHMWGSGGLGLSGVGEGGGGRGEGIGLGAVGTLGHGAGASGSGVGFGSGHGRLAPGVRVGSSGLSGASQWEGVGAGEWDDNANFREFSKWIAKESAPGVKKLDLSVRRFLVVRDAAGKPVPSCPVEVTSASGKHLTLSTTATGRALFFPHAEGMWSEEMVAVANCQGEKVKQSFKTTSPDGVVDLALSKPRVLPEAQTIDVAFVLDTTGSMSEEINALRDTLEKVAGALSTLNIRPRVGLVEYKDRGDSYVTRLHQMTTDIPGMTARIAAVSAGGGGDTPEHVNEAVRVAVRGLKFKPESIARLVFLIGDAPPHLDYQQDEGYETAMKEASHAGVQIFGIAASGMDSLGQVVWRQLAQFTGGTHMFVLRGGAGPQSTGGGDPKTSCGTTRTDYSSQNLDALIVSKVRAAIAAKDENPLRIAGLGQDEKDRPCAERVAIAF